MRTISHQIPKNRHRSTHLRRSTTDEAEQNLKTALAGRKKSPPGVSFVGMLFGNAGLIDFFSGRRILKRILADPLITSCTIQGRTV